MLLLSIFESIKVDFVLSQLGWIDLVIAILFVLGAIIGFIRGVGHQLPRLIALIATTVVSIHFYDRISQLVTEHSSISPVISQMAAFFLLAIGTTLVANLILSLCAKLVKVEFVYALERIGGLGIGACRYVLLFSLVSFFITLLPLPVIEELYSTQSLGGDMILQLCSSVHDYSITLLKAFVTGLHPEAIGNA